MENLITIVRGTTARLTHICNGRAYYQIDTENHKYQLELDSTDEDWKSTYLLPEFKAIELMRWIRKGMSDGRFVLIA